MKRTLVIVVLAACALLVLHVNGIAKRRPFIRGVFVAWYPDCTPGPECCHFSGWQNERNLLYLGQNNLHVNHTWGWEYPPATWVDSVCNLSYGAVRKSCYDLESNVDNACSWQESWWRQNVIDDAVAAYNVWGNDSIFGYTLGDEKTVFCPGGLTKYPGLDYICWVADSIDQHENRYTSIIEHSTRITPGFSDSVPHLDYFETMFYPYGSATPPSGQAFQAAIDGGMVDLNNLMDWFKDDSPSWMANIQVSAWDEGWFGGSPFGGYCDHVLGEWMRDTSYPESLQARYPSREEIRLLAFLAISRGAKGLRVFAYSPGIGFFTMDWGLLDVRVRRKFYPSGDSLFLPDYYPDTLRYCYPSGSLTPYDHVAELYGNLEPHGDLLTNLYVTGAGSFRQNRDSTVTFIKGVRCSDSAQVVPPGYWWEASTFIDTALNDDADFFMLVNRITCNTGIDDWQPAGYRSCDVRFTRPVGYAPVIQDVFSNEIWFLTQPDNPDSLGYSWWSFTDSVGPGDGNIYRVTDVFTGPVTGNVTLANDAILTQDLVITSTGTLTINPGVDIYVYPDTDAYNQGQYDNLVEVIVRGGGHLNVIGTASDSVRFIPWQSQELADWQGIYIDQNGHCDLDYCSIRYANMGLEARNYADISVSHCDMSNNSSTGIYCYKSDLNLQHSRVANNGIYGVYGYSAGAYIYASKFIDNDAYEIYLGGEAISGDSTLLLYDTLTTVSNPWGYGIYLGADKAEIYKCFVDRHQQYALTLYNSNAYVHNSVFSCHLTLGGLVGIYADNYSYPKIRYCSLDSLIICVKTNSSRPNMGTEDDKGKSSLSLNSSVTPGSTYYIYHSYRAFIPDTFYAQHNYYDTLTPNPQKFYHAYPTSPIKYWPWLTQPPPPPKMEGEPEIPFVFAVKQNFPNPFNPVTTISFSLDQPGFTRLTVYNILGQRLTTLLAGEMAAGEHVVIWHGRTEAGEPVSSGVYFYAIQTAEHFETKKMTLLR